MFQEDGLSYSLLLAFATPNLGHPAEVPLGLSETAMGMGAGSVPIRD